MRSRIKKTANWLKKFGPVLRAIEVGEMVWGLWERIPLPMRGWAWRIVVAPFLVAALAFVSKRVGESQDILTENWGWAILAGLLLAATTWAVFEAARYRSMQGAHTEDRGVELDEPPSQKVSSPGRRVSVTEDIDGKYLRLKVTNVGDKEEEFEVKFDEFHGTGEEETAYNARWRGTSGRRQRLKADDSDYINVAECLGPTGTGKSKLRFFTADLPVGEGISHYFEREIPLGYAVSWMFTVHTEPPLAIPLRKSCMIDMGKDGWVKAFTIDADFGGFTGPPMQTS